MSSSYIQFDDKEVERPGFLKKAFMFSLSKIFPQANPDFDKKIDDVKTWLLEFENQEEPPTREVGLDSNGRVIVKMPYEENHGYWTDNNMLLKDFEKHFTVKGIGPDLFEEKWKSFS